MITELPSSVTQTRPISSIGRSGKWNDDSTGRAPAGMPSRRHSAPLRGGFSQKETRRKPSRRRQPSENVRRTRSVRVGLRFEGWICRRGRRLLMERRARRLTRICASGMSSTLEGRNRSVGGMPLSLLKARRHSPRPM